MTGTGTPMKDTLAALRAALIAMGVTADSPAVLDEEAERLAREERQVMTVARRPRRDLTPVDITARFPAFRSGVLEAWSALSRDGVWKYERLEISGTPWQVTHVPTGIDADWYGTLTAARAATADGSALASVQRIQAHDRGEHNTEREPRCLRC
jgi:hypothetical protein